MNDILNTIETLHQQLKNLAITSLQNDQDIEAHVLDAIKAVYALKLALRQQSI